MRAALVTVAGTSAGNAVLLAAIALGLGWVLRHAVHLFEVLRWVGAVYLIWLGIQAWRTAGRELQAVQGNRVHFWRGFTVALSNPKTIAFFTAFLPQFVDPAPPGRLADHRHVRGLGIAGGGERFLLGSGRRTRPQLVRQARTHAHARPRLRPHAIRRGPVAVTGPAAGVTLTG